MNCFVKEESTPKTKQEKCVSIKVSQSGKLRNEKSEMKNLTNRYQQGMKKKDVLLKENLHAPNIMFFCDLLPHVFPKRYLAYI